ncbi:MAG: gliding motility-associated C-terminal domain-containing protein, partial [Bacteroidia bacterium]
ASPNTTVAIGNFVTLTANGGNGTYSWSPSGTLSCPNCASTEATPTVTTTYYVTYTDANGCTATDSVLVEVVEEYSIFVPDAFTPNNDGANDVFFVRGAGIKTLTFQVYDRVGEKIFESTSTRDGWDGTFRGQPMNTGVFVYFVTAEFYNGTTEVLKGNVTLVR